MPTYIGRRKCGQEGTGEYLTLVNCKKEKNRSRCSRKALEINTQCDSEGFYDIQPMHERRSNRIA